MAESRAANRAARTAVVCGATGFVATWLVHLGMARFLRSASPFELWDGTMPSLCGGLLAALSGLFLSRIVRQPVWLIPLCGLMLLGVPILITVAGFSGLLFVDILLRFVGRTNDNDVIALGYYVMPPVWATLIGTGLCWYYKATHGGVSLLNFEPPPRYDAEPPK